jgi:hypothetical protein
LALPALIQLFQFVGRMKRNEMRECKATMRRIALKLPFRI